MPSIEEWNALKDSYRKTYPGLPLQRPFREYPAEPGVHEMIERQLSVGGDIEGILIQQQIAIKGLHTWTFRERTDFELELDEPHVLAIETKDLNNERWETAAQEIFMAAQKWHLPATTLQVEIFNRDKLPQHKSALLPNDPTLISDLETIKVKIISEVQQRLSTSWTSIAFHSRTSRSSTSKPTVIVFCKPKTEYDFESLLKTLIEITSLVESSIEVEIHAGEISLCDSHHDKGIDILKYGKKGKPVQSASIAVEGTDDVGTLGGNVWLRKGKTRIPCFLTCYHVIRSNDIQTRQHQDTNGIELGQQDDLSQYTAVECPASRDYKATRCIYEKRPDSKSELAKIDKMIKRAVNGRVIAASGFRVSKGSSVNWALIRDTSQSWRKYAKIRPKNWREIPCSRPIPESALDSQTRPPNYEYQIKEDGIIGFFDHMEPGVWVAKNGRTSDWTTGEVNHMARICNWPEKGETTEEMEVIGQTGIFAAPGDSGSFVHNHQGSLVAMLFAKDDSGTIGLVTRITDLVEDLERVTGGFLALGDYPLSA
ncbi:hypothetical protein MMC14_006870 [Varicellaria rhodocarpa]|nr:hypothetical protein [Varicellaria rhodocarpa]